MKRLPVALVLLLLVIAPGPILGQHSHAAKDSAPPTSLAAGMGEVNHPVSTTNADAQKFFNQGLAYLYGFNHEEAVRSFRRAAELDPQLAMAHWGIALALGSNYNLQADAPQLKEAYTNVQQALQLAGKVSDHEGAYIEALAKRYSNDVNADRQQLATAYKNAMGQLATRFPDDLDAATLYAESMMNLRPWKLWSLDGKPAEGTEEIVAVLESVLRRDPNHVGANHYYIHAVEASKTPERALPSATRLGKLAPKAGHLVHMPSHVYIRTGDYQEAARSNADAIVADREYIQKSNAQGVYPMMYYNHNIHFLASAHTMQGRYADGIKAARELEANVKPHLEAMPMLEMFMPYTTVAIVRFAKWDEMLKSPKPAGELKITTAFWHFGRGRAYAARNQVAEAEGELNALRAVIKTVPAEAGVGNNSAHDVLRVSEALLSGSVALARGDKQLALELLRKAVAAEDAVSYNEPADWDLPVREVLGGALLMNGNYAEAENVFRAEIAKHPRNGRALFGLHESLLRQKKDSLAQMVKIEFDKAWANADSKLSVEDLAGMSSTNKTASHDKSPSLRFSDVWLKTGVRLRYAEQGSVAGHPVIMLHGYTDSWFSFSQVLPLLDGKYRIFVLDQRGHGDSERPAVGYAMSQFATDVLAFMDAQGLKQATIVGHSMGSFVAQRVAEMAPQRVTRLVLIGSGSTIRNDAVLGLQQSVNALTDPVSAQFVREFQESTVSRPVPTDFMNRLVAESLKLPARVWREVMDGMLAKETSVQLSNIKTPTLILWGEHETIFNRAEQELLIAGIKNAELKVYEATGHSPHWEWPDRTAQDLETFMSQTAQW
jgi:pimeloyl-ACP methyl ester carboxylesterase/tetratricopeptide (TPR) repeat protein